MDIKTVYSCPLGSECKTIKDNVLHQCLWYVGITEFNKSTGETREKNLCAIPALIPLMIEIAGTNIGQTDAICSMRDETLARQDKAISAMVEFKDHRNARTIEN